MVESQLACLMTRQGNPHIVKDIEETIMALLANILAGESEPDMENPIEAALWQFGRLERRARKERKKITRARKEQEHRDQLQYEGSANKIVCEEAKREKVTPGDMKSSSRIRAFTRPRQMAMYRIRDELGATNWSYTRIGRFFNRDHTTVLYAIKTIARELGTEWNTVGQAAAIEARLGV